VGKNPGAKIMQRFYWPKKSDGLEIPRILGLTASPVIRSKVEDISKVEENLDAISRTPTKNRAELLLYAILLLTSYLYMSIKVLIVVQSRQAS
jgi:hypothetical protein